MAEVTKDGTVNVDDQFVGRLEGFQFRLDPSASPEQAKTLKSAALAALAPEFSLRSDRMYNAPDSEFDLTEQGGLMWGTDAVGKLTKGSDILTPMVDVFVDDEAGAEIAAKVKRRLEHWLERRVAALFEQLVAIKSDETLTGLAKGVGFSLVEELGIIERSQIAEDVKSLDQEGRGLLRKHGIRFGQYTIFQPAMLKPAPTRLRLVLKSLFEGLDVFPEAPPPGLVTIPVIESVPVSHYTQAGYRVAGERALRIDMLERLADLIRACDSKAGFEATADMLSLTGLSHQQFSELMKGLGYAVEEEERAKLKRPDAKPADTSVTVEKDETKETEVAPEDATKPTEDVVAEVEVSSGEFGEEPKQEPEMETIYTFRWKGRPRVDRKQAGSGKRPGNFKKSKSNSGKGRDKSRNQKSYKPQKAEKPIDPDNPFAALMALKEKG